jgi:hypothetical protein
MEDHMLHRVGSSTFEGALFAIAFINDIKAAGRAFFEKLSVWSLMTCVSSSLPQNVGIDKSMPWRTLSAFSTVVDDSRTLIDFSANTTKRRH